MSYKLVILAGGYGTRISEESMYKPKPMIEIGGKPIIWHLMKYYSNFGIKEFIICTGYKSNEIKEYFNNLFLHIDDVEFDFKNSSKRTLTNNSDVDWKVKVIDTGLNTMTGGRLKKIKKYVSKDDFFLMTYGDGLSNINIEKKIKYFKNSNKLALVSAVKQPSRFGVMQIKDNLVNRFEEKPVSSDTRINGGFFILKPEIVKYLKNNDTIWEQSPLKLLAKNGELLAYRHDKFWQPMDTLRDKIFLNKVWKSENCPWKK